MKAWLWGAADKTVYRAKTALKGSRILHRLPLLEYTYLLELPRAIVLDELGLAFVPIPKVANRSMKKAFADHVGLTYGNDPHSANWNYVPVGGLEKIDHYKFAFVRNPLDRLLSCYAQKILFYGRLKHMRLEFWRYGDRFTPRMSFAEFVKSVDSIPDHLSDRHFRSQHRFIYRGDRCAVDFLGKFEHLERDWADLGRRFGLPELPHENRSPRREWRDAFTPELARIASRRYAKDIELFGYGDAISDLI